MSLNIYNAEVVMQTLEDGYRTLRDQRQRYIDGLKGAHNKELTSNSATRIYLTLISMIIGNLDIVENNPVKVLESKTTKELNSLSEMCIFFIRDLNESIEFGRDFEKLNTSASSSTARTARKRFFSKHSEVKRLCYRDTSKSETLRTPGFIESITQNKAITLGNETISGVTALESVKIIMQKHLKRIEMVKPLAQQRAEEDRVFYSLIPIARGCQEDDVADGNFFRPRLI